MADIYNPEEFQRLLYLARGKRTQKAFADECGISAQHYNRLCNGKALKMPTTDTIQKLAAHAANGVTFAMLMDAVKEPAAGEKSYIHEQITLCENIIRGHFTKMGYLVIPLLARQYPCYDRIYHAYSCVEKEADKMYPDTTLLLIKGDEAYLWLFDYYNDESYRIPKADVGIYQKPADLTVIYDHLLYRDYYDMLKDSLDTMGKNIDQMKRVGFKFSYVVYQIRDIEKAEAMANEPCSDRAVVNSAFPVSILCIDRNKRAVVKEHVLPNPYIVNDTPGICEL